MDLRKGTAQVQYAVHWEFQVYRWRINSFSTQGTRNRVYRDRDIPQVDAVLGERGDGRVEFVPDLNVEVADITFSRLFRAPESQNFLQAFCRREEAVDGSRDISNVCLQIFEYLKNQIDAHERTVGCICIKGCPTCSAILSEFDE